MLKGVKFTDEHRKHLSESHKGKPSGRLGKHNSEEHRKKLSESHKGIPSGMLGKHHSEETKKRWSELRKGRIPWNKGLKGATPWNKGLKGKPLSEETRKKISEKAKERVGEKNNRWKGGISFLPYCPKFNKPFKEKVRGFFNHTCQKCGCVWQPGEERLSVHHVKYNKHACCDDSPRLFVSLCRSCNIKVNNDRNFWDGFFTNKILLEYNGRCW